MEPITREILSQFEQVRKEGRVNMFDRNGVQVEASRLACYALVVWIEMAGKRGYADLLMAYRSVAETADDYPPASIRRAL